MGNILLYLRKAQCIIIGHQLNKFDNEGRLITGNEVWMSGNRFFLCWRCRDYYISWNGESYS